MIFKVSKKEQEEIDKFKEAFKIIYGHDTNIELIFGENNGIGRILKIRCEEIKVEKDITDYNNW